MNETHNIEINPEQRDMLLRGLRFIRSSVLLEMRNPQQNETELRSEKLREIDALVAQLNEIPSEPASV